MRRVFQIIQRIEEVLLATGILVIAALTIVNVFTRSALGLSLAFAEELSQFFIIVVTFVGAGYAASQGRHIRMTALYDQLSERRRKVLMLAISGSTCALCCALVFWSLRYANTVRELGTVSPALEVPLWLVYMAAPIGLGLTALQYGLTFYRNLRESTVYISYDVPDEYEAPAEDGI